jgi:hypothetical protein
VLTQVETLFVLRTTAPQDRDAIERWLEYHGESEDILASLAGLEDGDAWVVSRHVLRLQEPVRMHFRRRATFDSGATPKASERRRDPATLADVDLGAIRTKMAATIERAKAEDPRELRRQLAEVKAELARVKATATAEPVTPAPKPVKIPAVKDEQIARVEKLVTRLREDFSTAEGWFQHRIGELVTSFNAKADDLAAALRAGQTPPMPALAVPLRPAAPTPRAPRPAGPPTEGLDAGQQRILDTIGLLGVRGLPVTREAVARWMGIHPNGGRYNRSLARLRDSGYLDGLRLTDRGTRAVRAQDTGTEAALAALPSDHHRRVLREILKAHPEALTRETLAERLELHPNGGRYNRTLAWLRDMGVIPERGPITLTEGVFR